MNLFDSFVRREHSVKSSYRFIDNRFYFLVARIFPFQLHLHRGNIGKNLTADNIPLFTVNNTFLHKRIFHKPVFKLLGINVLTVIQNDQILGAAGNIDIAFLINVTQIAGTLVRFQ